MPDGMHAVQDGDEAEDAESEGASGSDEEAAKAAKRRKEKARDKAREVERKERALHVAQLELKVAKRGADQAAAEHEWKLARAAEELEQAERALEVYREVEKPMLVADRALQLDRAKRRLRDARQDLEGILAIYVDEPEASAKEEIIARYESDVELAERGLALQEQRNAHAREATDAAREVALRSAVAKAERSLVRERSEKEQGRVQGELELLRKEHALVALEEELEDLRGSLKKLKKAASK